MKVNTKIRYGLRAMIEIGLNTPVGGILQKDIAANQNISVKYLDHILGGLKVAELIKKNSVKSGFVLTREPAEITIYDIYCAFEPGLFIMDCLDKNLDCSIDTDCDVKGFWCEVNTVISEKFKAVSLDDLMNK